MCIRDRCCRDYARYTDLRHCVIFGGSDSIRDYIAFPKNNACLLYTSNWDDHDRSHRYMARDIGWNYLRSTLPNSIILNYGDNDTFPLWNNQEIYGVRPDVRIMNTSYPVSYTHLDVYKRQGRAAAAL